MENFKKSFLALLALSVIIVNINLFSLPVLGTAYNIAHAQISSESNIPSCQNLWWHDNSHQYCQQQQFCGAYMYAGLHTFQTKEQCEEDLNPIQSLTLTSPNGGESWQTGEAYNITWNSSGIDKVNIYFQVFADSGVTRILGGIATNVSASAGKYSWTIPYSITIGVENPPIGIDRQVIISEVDRNVSDGSDKPFTIVAGMTCSEKCESQGYEKGVCRVGSLFNPAGYYCVMNGYTFEIRTAENGDQYGVCIFPDGTECLEWAFYNGTCNQQYAKKEYNYLKYGCNDGEVGNWGCSASDCYDLMEVPKTCCCLPTALTPTQTYTPQASSDTNTALQVQLNGLLVTLQSLQAQARQQGSSAPASDFGQQVRAIAINLGTGSKDNNVNILQQFLISQNKGPAAQALAKVGATAYFGGLTRVALAEFQAKVGISPALGNFGPITRTYLSTH